MIQKNTHKQEGFTLIELMLVVLIIGVLSGILLGVMNVSGLQKKSRDARRIGDLKKIQTALELFYADNRGYPERSTWTVVTNGTTGLGVAPNPITPGYTTTLPTDPSAGTAAGKTCYGLSNYNYYYISDDCTNANCLSNKYVLGFIMEIPHTDTGTTNPALCSNLYNCNNSPIGSSTCNCSGTDKAYCYAVENPL